MAGSEEDQPRWGLSRSSRLCWALFPDSPGVVYHSGSGQTFALDELGRAVLELLQESARSQFELHRGLFSRGLLSRSDADARRLFGVLKTLHAAALIDRQWPDAFAD